MSRHRTVRSMNYEDEYDGYDDVYGHSVEDDYCVSPCTAAQFTFDRSNQQSLSSFLASEEIPEEDEEEEEEEGNQQSEGNANNLSEALRLTATQQAQLNACLEDLRSILDESVSEQQMVEAVISAQFDTNAAVNALLNAQPSEAAKPQRLPRERHRRADDPANLSCFPSGVTSVPNRHGVCSLAAFAKHLSSVSHHLPVHSTPRCSFPHPSPGTPSLPQRPRFSLSALAQQNLVTMTNGEHHSPTTLQHDNDTSSHDMHMTSPKRSMPNTKPDTRMSETISLSMMARQNTPAQAMLSQTPKKPPSVSLAALASAHVPEPSSVKPPPGFRGPPALYRPPGFHGPSAGGALNLSQLAALQSGRSGNDGGHSPIGFDSGIVAMAATVISNVKKKRKVTAYKTVMRAKPSLFARTLCSRFKAFSTAKLCKRLRHSALNSGLVTLTPFDFCTPSPDDIVQEKQKAAFTNPALRAKMDVADPPLARPGTMTVQNGDLPSPARFQFGHDDSLAIAMETVTVEDEARLESLKSEMMAESTKRDGSAEPARRDLQRVEGSWIAKSASAVELTGLVNQLNVTPRKEPRSSTPTPRSTTKTKAEKVDLNKAYEQRKATDGKECINLVVTGHVDAGKSTLMGHLLYQLGFVQQRILHKYEQEAKKLGKASFAFAWVLDETDEERTRGVTMDVAQTKFETESKVVTLLDAPGHKDFIPNMITGAAQADVAMLVVNATRGEFETGFESGGQTREHAMLIRSLGVSQLLVAINKMDTVDWSEQRYIEITRKLGVFLRQAGFREADVTCVPCSGLAGHNLSRTPEEVKLTSWYSGPTLVQQIDRFRAPERSISKPLRMCVADIFKGQGSGVSVSGLILTGAVLPNDRLLVMPQAEIATVKGVLLDEMPAQCAFAGDNVVLVMTGIDMNNITVGSIMCSSSQPIRAASCFRARIVLFNIDIPITKGFPVVFHYQSLSETAHVHKLISQLHKSTGEVIKKKPRCLTRNSTAVVDLKLSRPICMELYRDFKELGRFMLRSAGSTIAAGLITQLLNCQQ